VHATFPNRFQLQFGLRTSPRDLANGLIGCESAVARLVIEAEDDKVAVRNWGSKAKFHKRVIQLGWSEPHRQRGEIRFAGVGQRGRRTERLPDIGMGAI